MSHKTTQAIKTRQNKLTRRLKKLPSLGQAILMLVVGLVLGTVFIFLMQYTQGPVSINEAIPVSAVMEDVRGSFTHRYRQGTRLQEILIRFEDYEQLDIDSIIATESMLTRLAGVPSGTTFDMLVHPNSTTILALSIDGEDILTFEDCMAKLQRENAGFFWLGMAMYFLAVFGAATAIIRIRLRRF